MRLRRSSSAFEPEESAFVDAVSPARTAGESAGFAGFASAGVDEGGGAGEVAWARIVAGVSSIEHKTATQPTTRVAQRGIASVIGFLGGH